MRTLRPTDLDLYIDRLKNIPFVEATRLLATTAGAGELPWDAELNLRIAGRWRRFFVEHKATARLNYALVDALLGRLARHGKPPWILFTPYVTPPMAVHLQENGVNYVDAAGNCHLIIDRKHVAIIDGRRPNHRPEEIRMVGPRGYQVLFALLARPELLQATVRELAATAGVGKTIAALALRRLEQEGLTAKTRTTTVLVKPTALLDRWLAGYTDILRPKLLVGYFRPFERDPADLEKRIAGFFGGRPYAGAEEAGAHPKPEGRDLRWVWGGAAAAYRLTGHYRGERTVVHVDRAPHDLARRLRILPDRTGPLHLLRAPGPLAFAGAAPGTAHPLLVYGELIVEGNDRARETAVEIRERFLEDPR